MEEWQLDFEWLQVRHMIQDRFGRDTLPDLNAILFLIGIQELGRWQKSYTKEEKQDLMHIAICQLLSYEGYYEFAGRDADGWPHWKQLRVVPKRDLREQELLLKMCIVRYFKEWEREYKSMEARPKSKG
jgi:hypothetical protein